MGETVGRLEAQLALRTRVKAVREGRRGVVLVAGDTGTGKSRLLAEEGRYAERLGLHVLSGQADEQRSGRPYVALRSALDASLRAERDPVLRRLAVEVEQQLRVAPSSGSVHRPSPAGRSVVRLVGAWCARSPVVLAVDDLQAADRDTCDLLGQLLRQLARQPLLVVASLREPLPPHVDALVRLWERQLGPDVARVELGPLDRHDALVLARDLHPGEVDPQRLEAVVAEARGNPLLLQEAVDALRAQRPFETGGDGDATAELVLRRLHRLHPDAVGVGAVLALLERPRPALLPLVADVLGCPPDVVAAALDALLADGTLRLDGGGYRFALPVVRRVLVDHLGPARRWQLHGQVAAHLSQHRADGEAVDVVELAPHLAASAAPGDARAVEVLLEVAARYADRAPQSAADWYGRALALLPEGAPERPGVLADRARVLFLAARLEEAVADGRQALAGGALTGRDATRSGRTGTIVTAALLSLGRIRDAVDAASELLATSAVPSPRVRAQLAAGLQYLNRFDESRRELEAVLSAGPDPTTAALAHGVRAQLALSTGGTEDLLQALDAAYAVDGLPEGARLSALTNDATLSVLASELDRATAVLAQARALADSLGAVAFDADLELTGLMLDWRSGRWRGLEERIARTVAELEGRGQRINVAMLSAMRLELLTARGRLGEAAAVDATLGAPDAIGFSFVAWAQAGYRVGRGDAAGALALLQAAWAHDLACGRVSSAALVLSRTVEVALALGLPDEAAARARELDEVVRDSGLARSRSLALRARGLVAQDAVLLREAAHVADQDGMPVEAALARLAAGRLSGDAETDLLPALHGFVAVEAEVWRRQAAALLRAQGVTVPRAPRRTGGGSVLTDAELRLARLVHDGLSNKQIASALALSPKTIEVYLSRVFVKTGVRSRVELAVALSEGRVALQE